MIISEKAREKEMLLENIVDTIVPEEVAQVPNPIDLAKSYNWAMSNTDLDTTKKLGLTGIKKY